MMLELLQRAESELGNRLAAIATARLSDVKEDFDREGIEPSKYYTFAPGDDLGFKAASVLMLAVPSPFASVVFTVGGERKSVIIPPTYENRGEIVDACQKRLADALAGGGFHIAPAKRLPMKPIAAHAGIAKLGRNNIAYVDRMGSFANLMAFYSDLPVDEGAFYPIERMEACENCAQCAKLCPTGAIRATERLIDADRCLTAFNEHGGEFPDWIDPKWHNALVGCTLCQTACPQNATRLITVEVASYDEVQTAAFLRGELPPERLSPLGYPFDPEIFARNLKMLEGFH